MDSEFNALPLDDCSDLISRAFGGSKLSPYTDLSSLYDYTNNCNMFSNEYLHSGESSVVNSARSAFSSMVSVETTHVDNSYSFAWSDTAEVHTPRQSGNSSNMDEQDAKLLKVIKSLFTQSMIDVLRKYVEELFTRDSRSMEIQRTTGKIHLDIDDLRTRIFAVIRKCLTNNTEINIVHIIETIREKYDTTLVEDAPSFGSITHANGYCKPCVFANKTVNSCKNGADCNFCHFKHRITRRKNAAKETHDIMKQRKDALCKDQTGGLSPTLDLHAYLSSHKGNRQLTQVVENKHHLNIPANRMGRSNDDVFSTCYTPAIAGNSPFASLDNYVDPNEELEDALIAKCVEFLERKYNTNNKRR
ncbi:hypothetical protein BaOVIS_017960 [Babesia ovis]|uniref:C3H1-type domain-containing protein n=1 Tax=Babesia ovis TaxID=5869 RepID=A0A9W5TDD6_BABOV|nr:hypothetical protein BaOVIS_017960 [Babesia ovis]